MYKSLSDVHNSLHKNVNLNIIKLWNLHHFPEEFKINMIHTNKTIANRQVKGINEITQFINSQNYYGDNYQMYRQLQIEAAKYWVKVFLPSDNDFSTMLDYTRKSAAKIIDKTKQLVANVKYY